MPKTHRLKFVAFYSPDSKHLLSNQDNVAATNSSTHLHVVQPVRTFGLLVRVGLARFSVIANVPDLPSALPRLPTTLLYARRLCRNIDNAATMIVEPASDGVSDSSDPSPFFDTTPALI